MTDDRQQHWDGVYDGRADDELRPVTITRGFQKHPAGSVLVVTNVLMPLPRADLRCLDLEKGEELWRREGLGYFHFGAITTGDGKLLLLEDTGHAVLAEVTRQEFKQLARSQVCRGTLTSPAFADGKLYVRDDQEIVCVQFNPTEGSATDKP